MDSHAHAQDTAHAGGHTAGHAGGHAPGEHHVASSSLFLKVLVTLLILTFITVTSSRFDFGGANMLIAMFIASVKAALVITIFMHMKWDTAINRIFFIGSFLFLSLLFTFTLSDLATRGRDNTQLKVRPPVANDWVHPAKAKEAH